MKTFGWKSLEIQLVWEVSFFSFFTFRVLLGGSITFRYDCLACSEASQRVSLFLLLLLLLRGNEEEEEERKKGHTEEEYRGMPTVVTRVERPKCPFFFREKKKKAPAISFSRSTRGRRKHRNHRQRRRRRRWVQPMGSSAVRFRVGS